MNKTLKVTGAALLAATLALSFTGASEASARYSCPVGDGTVNWGDGKVCTDPEGARIHFRDSLTDGDCVQVLYYSSDASAWRTLGPKACVTGQWVTFTAYGSILCEPNLRLSRGPGEASFAMPNNYC
jgi:hypothetical protein